MIVTLALYAALALRAGAGDGFRFLAMTRTGSAWAQPGVLLPGQRADPGLGYDGQFDFYLAQDPFLRRPATAASLDGGFRYRRLLYPLLAWLLAGGNRLLVPYTLVLVNVLAAAALAGVAAWWAVRHGRSAWSALALSLFAGVWIPTLLDLTEPLHLALLAAGMVFSSAGLLLLSGLTRELGAVGLVTEAVRAAAGRRWTALGRHAAALAALAAWSLAAALAVPPGTGRLGPSGTGDPLFRLRPFLSAPLADPVSLAVAVVALALLAGCVARLALYRDRMTWPAAVYGVAVFFSGTLEPDPASAFRLIAGAVVLTYLAWCVRDDRLGRWLVATAGISGTGLLLLVLLVAPLR